MPPQRDDARTKKLMEEKFSKEELKEIERRKYKDEDERDNLLPKLRWEDKQLAHAAAFFTYGNACAPLI